MATNTQGEARKTAPCTKCTTEIPVEADRCPQCGYEPSSGIFGKIFAFIVFSNATLFAVITIVIPITALAGAPLTAVFSTTAVTGTIAALLFGFLYLRHKTISRGPTEKPPLAPDEDRDPKSFEESMQDGWERGEAIGERINSIGPMTARLFPAWTWTVVALLGAALNLSVWVSTGLNDETGMMVGVVGGGLLSFFAVLTDVKRLNWIGDEEYAFRWWFWSLLAFVPLFGWLFTTGWLARKRQKTGSFV